MTQTIMMKFVILQDSTPRVLTLSPAEWLRLERQVGKQLLEAQGLEIWQVSQVSVVGEQAEAFLGLEPIN